MKVTITKDDFGGNQAAAACRLSDYLEDKQLQYLINALDGNDDGGIGERFQWVKRGFMPIVRNIVKPLIEKSAGNLFVQVPKFSILPSSSPQAKPVVDPRFNELQVIADFQSFGQEWNRKSRLLKSVVILQQQVVGGDRLVDNQYTFDETSGDLLVYSLLHRGNSVVRMNATRTKITELAYLVSGCPSDDEWQYRYLNAEIDELVTVKGGEEIAREPSPSGIVGADGTGKNADGFVPAVMHYDTSKPSADVWHQVPEDIRTFQDFMNMFMTDIGFATFTQMAQPLYTDAEFLPSDGSDRDVAIAGARLGEKMSYRPQTPKDEKELVAGIGAVIQLKKDRDSKVPFVQHVGPNAMLDVLQGNIESMFANLASDWSVNLKVGGDASAQSGFQLVVEEIDNLNLRAQRSVNFITTLRKMYAQQQKMYPELMQGELQVEFTAPSLPVNQVEVVNLWITKIQNDLASPIDYLMEVEGLSEEEAKARYAEIRAMSLQNQKDEIALQPQKNDPRN